MKNKTIKIGLLIGIIVFIILELTIKNSPPLLETNKIKTKDIQITAIGDSLTKGVGDEENSGYLAYLKENLDEYNLSTVNYGKSGDTTTMITKRIEENKQIQQDLKEANIITLTVGGNDLMQVLKENIFNLTEEKVEKYKIEYIINLEKTYNEIRKYNPKSPIYILGIYNPFYLNFKEITELQEIVNEWNSATLEFSKNKMHFIPINDQIYKGLGIDDDSTINELLSSYDSFHPNSIGYRIIAREFTSKIISTENEWRNLNETK